ncbi:phospholipase D-like domain-containing protein [Cellulomonas rhizosphaerae]|uniref:Uncharacterized protein n=1 Tax=Cellulomonas rhizosphaerae TaxID=2293719 RepID=A0A413RLL5_9CELL|nr:phospholipase D family protein [Cellulomonas rhizosphaerae]RHA40990.1 hypothetical protein D1825_09375 [Cellulomonas rhizosphaerae]
MDIRFVTQPFADGEDLRDFLDGVAADNDLMTLRVAVAWAKRSGLARIESGIRTLRDRGGRLLVVVGISEGGGTRQGMEWLMRLADEVYVFHDSGRTFHPKVYLASGERTAMLLVGSQNLTLGGLAWNYEAALVCELDLAVPEDSALHSQVIDYFERLRADESVCLELDDERLRALLADPALQIKDEDDRRPRGDGAALAEELEDVEGASDEMERAAAAIFGRSREPKRAVPQPVSGTAKASPGSSAGSTAASPSPSGGSATPSAPAAGRRWFKRMDGTAAQKPPSPASKPTGNLRLSQEDFAIDHTRYFRQVFFGGEVWTARASDPRFEDLTVPMTVVVDGVALGTVDVKVSHAEHRISDQGNVPTVLHWGAKVGQVLRQGNYVGSTVTLEHSAGGQYRLTIGNNPTGPFSF